jgi:hypothetical protein
MVHDPWNDISPFSRALTIVLLGSDCTLSLRQTLHVRLVFGRFSHQHCNASLTSFPPLVVQEVCSAGKVELGRNIVEQEAFWTAGGNA